MKTLLKDKETDNIYYVIKSKTKNDITKRVIKISNGDVWAENHKGKKLGSLVDNDNGVSIKFGEREMEFDYGEFCELFHLMKEHVIEEDNLMGGFKRLKG